MSYKYNKAIVAELPVTCNISCLGYLDVRYLPMLTKH